MSRSQLPPPRRGGRRWRRSLRLSVWSGSCILAGLNLTGCPFVLPFIEVDLNVPPTIEHSSPGEGETLVIDTPQYTAFVIARDPDDTELSFFWEISDLGVQPNATPLQDGTLLGSQLTVEAKADYDGHTLTVFVIDPQGATTQRSWPITVTADP